MIIICPSCTSRYEVDPGPAELAGSRRSLRCSRCGDVWQATPVDPPAEILPPTFFFPRRHNEAPDSTEDPWPQARLVPDPSEEAAGNPQESAAGTEEESSVVYRAARRSIAARRRPARSAGPAKAFVLGVLLALAAAGLHYRHDVVLAVPSSAGLFQLVGLPVNLYGLDFRNVESRRSFEDGLPVLVIEGEIVNLRDVSAQVPALRIAVRGEGGEVLYSWRVEPRQRELEGGGTLAVRSRLAAPPGGAHDVELRFEGRPAAAGPGRQP